MHLGKVHQQQHRQSDTGITFKCLYNYNYQYYPRTNIYDTYLYLTSHTEKDSVK
jgi:hypothetical protein